MLSSRQGGSVSAGITGTDCHAMGRLSRALLDVLEWLLLAASVRSLAWMALRSGPTLL